MTYSIHEQTWRLSLLTNANLVLFQIVSGINRINTMMTDACPIHVISNQEILVEVCKLIYSCLSTTTYRCATHHTLS
jgi:hypothetical protein